MKAKTEFDLDAAIEQMISTADQVAAENENLAVTSKRRYNKAASTSPKVPAIETRTVTAVDVAELTDDFAVLLDGFADMMEIKAPEKRRVETLSKRTIRVAEKYDSSRIITWFPEAALVLSLLIIFLPMTAEIWNRESAKKAGEEIREGPSVETAEEF